MKFPFTSGPSPGDMLIFVGVCFFVLISENMFGYVFVLLSRNDKHVIHSKAPHLLVKQCNVKCHIFIYSSCSHIRCHIDVIVLLKFVTILSDKFPLTRRDDEFLSGKGKYHGELTGI